MIINLEIPDEYKDKRLMLLAAQELVASKVPWEDSWLVKDVRCDQCGSCCMDVPPNHLPYGTDDEGKCNMLYKENDKWLCKAGNNKPWCCLSDPLKENAPDCCITYVKQKA